MNAPETILILDTETTGVTDSDTAIEVACILYSLKHAAPIRSFASLIRADSNPAEHVNRIPASLLPCAPEAAAVWTAVARHVTMADVIVAHNADFDRRFVPAMTGANITPWVCSMDDIAWPVACESRSLVSIADRRAWLRKMAVADASGQPFTFKIAEVAA